MPEPISIVLGTLGLTEGVRFLFGQAGELLKRWRERRDKVAAAGAAQPPIEAVTVALPPSVFEGALTMPQLHHDKLTALQPELERLLGKIAVYQADSGRIRAGDEDLVKTMDDLRQILERVYQQPLCFKGEPARANPFVKGEAHVTNAIGTVIGADVETVQGNAHVEGTAFVGTATGEVTGLRAKTVGTSGS